MSGKSLIRMHNSGYKTWKMYERKRAAMTLMHSAFTVIAAFFMQIMK